jgi:hypothetical protein
MEPSEKITHKIRPSKTHMRIFIAIFVLALFAGTCTGYILAATNSTKPAVIPGGSAEAPKAAQQDTRTFRDFAEGKIAKKPEPKPGQDYTEGTHLLIRTGQTPVALTSSVVDLSKYEGKNVKVFGETQKAVQEGWLMDVGRVEEK